MPNNIPYSCSTCYCKYIFDGAGPQDFSHWRWLDAPWELSCLYLASKFLVLLASKAHLHIYLLIKSATIQLVSPFHQWSMFLKTYPWRERPHGHHLGGDLIYMLLHPSSIWCPRVTKHPFILNLPQGSIPASSLKEGLLYLIAICFIKELPCHLKSFQADHFDLKNNTKTSWGSCSANTTCTYSTSAHGAQADVWWPKAPLCSWMLPKEMWQTKGALYGDVSWKIWNPEVVKSRGGRDHLDSHGASAGNLSTPAYTEMLSSFIIKPAIFLALLILVEDYFRYSFSSQPETSFWLTH